MDIFKLVGTIFVKNDEANSQIEATSEKAGTMAAKIGGAINKVGDGMQKFGKKLAPLSAGVTAIGAVSVKTAASFEDGMLKVQSLSGATGEEFNKLKQTAKDFGSSTAWTAKDVADAMGYMALAGFDTNEILASTGGMLSLASASGENLATVTDILTDSMTAFGDSAADAERYADVLATTQAKSNTTVGLLGEAFRYAAPLAGSYGYQIEDVSAALGMMANAGVKGSMAGTSLSAVITRLGTNTGGARDAIEKIGVEFYNTDGTARNLSAVMKDLSLKTSGMTVEEKANFAATVAGREAQKGLLAILNQGADAYANLEEQIKNSNGTAAEMAENMESGLGGSMRSFKSAIEGVSITIGEKLAPHITAAANKIKDLCVWFESLSPSTQNTIVSIGMFIAAAAPVLLIGGKLISGIGLVIGGFSKMIGVIKVVITVAKALWVVLAANPIILIVTVIAGLVAAFIHLWDTNENFRNFWINLWDTIKTACSNAINGIKGFFNGLIAAGAAVIAKFGEIKQGIADKINAAKDAVKNAIDKIKSFFNFSWALPKLKLPHFKVSGKFSLTPPSVPKFSISWYKKAMENPYLFTRPTLFDFNPVTGAAKGAGEAGHEIMIGKDTMLGMIQEAVSNEVSGFEAVLIGIFNLLTEYIPEMANAQLVLDTGVLVGELAPGMDKALGEVYKKRQRGV